VVHSSRSLNWGNEDFSTYLLRNDTGSDDSDLDSAAQINDIHRMTETNYDAHFVRLVYVRCICNGLRFDLKRDSRTAYLHNHRQDISAAIMGLVTEYLPANLQNKVHARLGSCLPYIQAYPTIEPLTHCHLRNNENRQSIMIVCTGIDKTC
jgi:hypothetical protein